MEYSLVTTCIGLTLGFFTGASVSWTSPEVPYLNSTDTGPFDGTLTDDEASWIGGFLSLGAIFGPFVAGYLADKIGRKYTMLIVSIPYVLSYVLLAFSKNVAEFYIARFMSGLSLGASITIIPMYVGEMCLDRHRNVMGSAINIFICFGIVFTYVAGSFIKNVMVFNIILAGLTGGFFVLFLFFGFETPNWYVSKNKHKLAKQTLLKIRKENEEEIEKELEHIKSVLENEKQGSILEIFRSKGTTKAFFIGIGLSFFQQASGINAILFFTQSIFETSGTTLDAKYCSMIIGSVQFGSSFITPLVSNRFGRKHLLVFSGMGIFIFESLLGIYSIIDDNDHNKVSSLNFLPILLLVSYIIVFNIGLGPIPLAMIGEIFPSNIRATASALAVSVCWATSFFVTKWFSQLVEIVGQGQCFLGFAVTSLVAVLFTHFFVVETKGKSLVQIQEDLNK